MTKKAEKRRIVEIVLVDRQGDLEDTLALAETTLSNDELRDIAHIEQDTNDDYSDESIFEALKNAGVEFVDKEIETCNIDY